MAQPIGHLEPREQVVEPVVGGLAPPVGQQGQEDVVAGRERGDQVERLEDQPDVAATKYRQRSVGHGCQVLAVDEYASGVGPGQAGHHVQQGALARSTGPHHGCELARLDREPDVPEGVDGRIALSKPLGHVLDNDGRGGGRRGWIHVGFPKTTWPRAACNKKGPTGQRRWPGCRRLPSTGRWC